MPVVAIIDLDYNPRTGYLVAATYGRGVEDARFAGWRRLDAVVGSRLSVVGVRAMRGA